MGGFLTCLGLMLSALALGGVIRPIGAEPPAAVAPSPSPSAVAAASAPSPSVAPTASGTAAATAPAGSAAASEIPSLTTPAPIASPAVVTPVALADGYALGDAKARVTVEVWEDYQCPFCRKYSEQVEPQIIATYVVTGKVRYVFRDLPFLGDESGWAAIAAQLASQQGKFWPYHDYLYANQLGENVGSFSVARLTMIADAIGLDRKAFDAGLQIDAARAAFAKIRTESQARASSLGITSTPTIVVGDTKLAGNDWATIKTAIDAALTTAK